MKYLNKNELLNKLEKMAILDIIMQSKEDAWLRLINASCFEDGKKFVIANGSGDELTVYITDNGVYIRGFDHESERNQFAEDEVDDFFFEKIYKNAPEEFLTLLEDEEKIETTFCMWNLDETDEWQENEIDLDTEYGDGGIDFLLGYICTNAEQWCDWAKDYYEEEFDIEVVNRIYEGNAVTAEDIEGLKPDRDAEEVLNEMKQDLNIM